MSISFRDRPAEDRPTADAVPTLPPGATLSERLVHRASGLFATKQSRRGFLAKTAVIGSALAVNPFDFILKPGTAYAALCGTCGDGWTAFCCTINDGKNSCPPGSFVAGWWKADNAAFCSGKARYIIDCNATCPTQCACRCSGASCDGRRVCCNQFRYGQCHQEISCYGPVVCRVATCTPAYQYDPSCTTTSATDNATVTHGAPCLTTAPQTDIDKLYASLGGKSGVLGAVTTSERATADRSGRYAHYVNGSIFERNSKPPFEVHGSIAKLFAKLQYHRGELGYPTTNQQSIGDAARGVFNRFEGGVIYSASGSGTHEVLGAIRTLHSSIGGVKDGLRYPVSGTIADGFVGRHQHFQQGSIWYSQPTGARWLTGIIRQRFLDLGAVGSPFGWPVSSHTNRAGGALVRFQRGGMYAIAGKVYAITNPIYGAYIKAGEVTGALGWPTSNPTPDGELTYVDFEHGRLTYDPATGQVTQS